MKRIFCMVVIMVLLCITFTAFGESTKFVNITKKSWLNVREEPSISAKRLGTLNRNDVVVVLEVIDSEWVQIKWPTGEAYVLSCYLSDTPIAINWKEFNFVMVGYANGTSGLNVRSGPGTRYSVYEKLKNNTELNIVKVTSNGWFVIEYKGGHAYVTSRLVSFSPLPDNITKPWRYFPRLGTVSSIELNIRYGPSTEHDIFDTVNQGTVLQLIGKKGDWYQVLIDDEIYYVYAGYIK